MFRFFFVFVFIFGRWSHLDAHLKCDKIALSITAGHPRASQGRPTPVCHIMPKPLLPVLEQIVLTSQANPPPRRGWW
uniref:Putative secreted protein n=1 Tax=Anopheles darlingi TaxID=43151 RepID=A0A2M4D5H6_ANODA